MAIYNIPSDVSSGDIITAEGFNNTKNSIDALKGGTAGDLPTRTLEEVNTRTETYSDHGNLSGLTGDDHLQYANLSGIRDFTGKISYDTNKVFTDDKDIVAKKYVDDEITAVTDGSTSITGVLTYDTNKTFSDEKDLVAKKYVDDEISAIKGVEVGTIIPYANNSVPTGYLLCDGSSVSSATYGDLYSAITTTWGGDATNFNLPDFEGAFLRGTGSHGSETMADGNPFAGPAVGSYENDAMQKITGHMEFEYLSRGSTSNDNFTGVFDRGTSASISAAGNGLNSTLQAVDFDSSNSTSPNVARTDDAETKVFNAGIKYCIKY